MEERKCELCAWFDYDDNEYREIIVNWCNKWEVPTNPVTFCNWYVAKDLKGTTYGRSRRYQ